MKNIIINLIKIANDLESPCPDESLFIEKSAETLLFSQKRLDTWNKFASTNNKEKLQIQYLETIIPVFYNLQKISEKLDNNKLKKIATGIWNTIKGFGDKNQRVINQTQNVIDMADKIDPNNQQQLQTLVQQATNLSNYMIKEMPNDPYISAYGRNLVFGVRQWLASDKNPAQLALTLRNVMGGLENYVQKAQQAAQQAAQLQQGGTAAPQQYTPTETNFLNQIYNAAQNDPKLVPALIAMLEKLAPQP